VIAITVAGSKRGVGKTTLTENPGAVLADRGLRVVSIEVDVRPSLSKYFLLRATGLTQLFVRSSERG
jgi:chromosome partitioning related protein ParA